MTIRDITYVGEGLIPAPLNGPALRYTPLPKGAVTDIAVHHMTGWNPPTDATVEQEVRFLQGIDAWHRSSRGLDGIGYHICPMASGRIYIVSRLDRYGAGVGYENDHLLHLALPGDYSSQLPAPGHLAAAVEAVRYAYAYLGRDVPTTPHLNWGGTTCPGARWREWVPQLQAAAQEEDDMNQPEFNKMFAEAVKSVLVTRQDEAGKRTSGGHTLGAHLEGLFQAIGAMLGDPKFKGAVWEAMKPIIGPRDETIARIDRELHDHADDSAKHSAGTRHTHRLSGQTDEA